MPDGGVKARFETDKTVAIKVVTKTTKNTNSHEKPSANSSSEERVTS